VLEEDMLEVDTTMLTPHEILKTSGHVDTQVGHVGDQGGSRWAIVIQTRHTTINFEGGGVELSGLYDYGPPGTALIANMTDLWRKHFVLEEDMLEHLLNQVVGTEDLASLGVLAHPVGELVHVPAGLENFAV
jgi:hypothetical protein